MPSPGQRRQFPALDAMSQLAWGALCGNEVVPAPRHMQGITQPQDPIGYRIPVMMVVEEPAIDLLLTKCGLDLFQVHELTTEQSALQQHARLQRPRPCHLSGCH